MNDNPSSPQSVAIELRKDLGDLATLAERVTEFGEGHGLAANVVSAMNLALEEAVTNSIGYGFDSGDTPRIRVDLAYDGQCLTASVEDNGRPFDPLQATAPAIDVPLDERQIGGLGIMLIRQLMDDVQYTRKGSTNVLVLRKRA